MSKCHVCGASEFDLDFGSLICMVCGTLESNFLELVEEFDEKYDPNRKRQAKINVPQRKEEDLNKLEELNWHSYEAYNFIIKAWSDRLTHLGVSRKFRETLFKLWIHYLQKFNFAFVPNNNDNQGESDKPAINPRNPAKFLKKEKASSKKEDQLEELKKKVNKKYIRSNAATRSKLVTKEMSATLEFSDIFNKDSTSASEDHFDDIMFDSAPLLTTFDSGLFESPYLMQIDDIFDEEISLQDSLFPHQSPSTTRLQVETSLRFISLPKILSLVYLAILISEEDILLLDLVRWCRNGYFPYQRASSLIPETKRFTHIRKDGIQTRVPTATSLRVVSKGMAIFLSLQIVPAPSLERVIEKFRAAFNLPSDLLDMVKPILNDLSTAHPNFGVLETIVAAAVLLIFKIYYGLDDEHEQILSDWAEKFNIVFEKKKSDLRIFSWRQWQCHISKMNWWLNEMDMSNNSSSLMQLHSTLVSKRFSQFYWNKNYSSKKMPTYNPAMNHYTGWRDLITCEVLNLNGINTDKADKYFDSDGEANFDAVRNLMNHSREEDKTPEESYMYQVGQELLERDFSNHSINWLLHSYKIVNEFQKMHQQIMIVPVPLNHPLKARLCQEHAKKKSKGKKSIFLIPDPMSHSYWTIKSDENSCNRFSSSFQWLLRVLSDYCQISQMNLFTYFFRLSCSYLNRASKRFNDNQKPLVG